MDAAFFGKPRGEYTSGGAHLAVYLVPVFDGRLVAFDVHTAGARDRWLPWGILTFGGNPYEDASALADDWCQGAVADLRLVDVISGSAMGSWELALVFRAELTAMPAADARRSPVPLPRPLDASIRQFQPADLERWLCDAGPSSAPAEGHPGQLLF
jgi:hypothetical protein